MFLDVRDLTITLKTGEEIAKDISFSIDGGEMLSIVGSSGAGKTTVCKAVMGLLSSNYSISGEVLYRGENLLHCSKKRLQAIYGKEICYIMQNPMTAFNPSLRIGRQLEKTCYLHNPQISRQELQLLVSNTLQQLGLDDLKRILKSYPDALSGGMLQRIMIAAALINQPTILVADEATTAIDACNRIYQDAQETMNHEAVEYIRGIAVVKVFGQTVKSFAKFHNAIETYKKYALAYTMSCKKGMVAFNAIVNSSFLVLVPIGFLVGFTTPTLRDFIQSFLFYVIFSPACAVMLNKIMYMTSYKMQAEESMRRIDMILTSKQQPEPAIPQYPDTYEVAFEDVTFAYDNTDHPAVSHLTFMAKAGAITALVGHSGSGKSTAASLIPRFYDVQDGAVKIGGVDIREIPQGDLMKMVAFVFQDPKLFKDSLLENIRAGRPSATREEVLKAAHLAQCDDILKKLPNGIDTIIGSQGIYLSGGETQRISIARAILKDAPIVVLDEATAYADPENEHQIQKAFDGLIKNKTVIMVAHRLSTVQDADQILVMKNGAIAESGTHSDLIKHQGEYAKMWDNYNKTVQWHIES